VLAATQAFQELRLPVYEVRYEDLVTDSVAIVRKLTEFMEVPAAADDIESAASKMRADRIGSGRASLLTVERDDLERELGNTLAQLGYDRPASENLPPDQPGTRGSS
jgi:hypothetical protein